MSSDQVFSVAGQTIWNSLSEALRDPECFVNLYTHLLKTFLYLQY